MIGVIAFLLISVFVYKYGFSNTGEAVSDSAKGTIIEMNDSAYSPKMLEINKGDTVTFINNGLNLHWPASASHPTHTVYPGSDIEKCNTSEENKIFESCRGVEPGKNWSFTFNEQGNWSYHDHLYPSLRGKILVK